MSDEVWMVMASYLVVMLVGLAMGFMWGSYARGPVRCPKCYFKWTPNAPIIEIDEREEPPVVVYRELEDHRSSRR